MAAGVVGFDLRDSDQGVSAVQDMGERIQAVLSTAQKLHMDDFVVNAVMAWPGTADEAIDRANQYLDAGATVVTILRRVPCYELMTSRQFAWMIRKINGRVGVVMKMPGISLDGGGLFARNVAELGAARIGYGNQWPHYIRQKFQRAMEVQFRTTEPT